MDEDKVLTKAERKELKKQQKQLTLAQESRKKLVTKIGWYIGLLAIIAIIAYLIFQSMVPIPQNEQHKPIDKVAPGDQVKGNPQAPVLIVEYSDFQCPSCARVAPILDEVLKTYPPNQVALVYRYFPLQEIHAQANLSAQAAEAAGKQAKFWEMHDLLFQNQTKWAENLGAMGIFMGYAQQLGLNVDQFKRDINSKPVRGTVKADYISALENALSSTPSFFINGELTVSPQTATDFKQVIDQKLQIATESAKLK
jgi:protein-disulfide isomerase